MSDDIAISVQGVSKDFHYNSNRANSVKGILTGIFKEEENKKDIQHALKDISFEVKKGEFFGIVGRNGSGKSTLLKIMAGIYQPNKGSVQINGKLVPFIELGVGFNPELTGKENVYLNGALLGFSKKEISAMYNEIVEFAELEKFMNQKLKNYSSGMQVRLAFSMAIRAESDILLIDEVLAVGDADFQRKCFDYFKSLRKKQKTVIFVSHDMNAIKEYCDKALLIKNGRVTAMGTAGRVAREYFSLFTHQEESTKKNFGNRWGNGAITYKKAIVEQDNDFIKLTLSLIVNQDIDGCNLGFTVRDSAGVALIGTNSRIKGLNIGPLSSGEAISISWSFPNVFSTGTYFVDPAAISENQIDVFDWWEGAKKFNVIKHENTPHLLSPNIDVSYKVSSGKVGVRSSNKRIEGN